MIGRDYSDEAYEKPIEIAEGIFWVGFYDSESGLHCNPYLIKDGNEAVVIDGGSRPDFPTVMMKILETGMDVKSIKALIYHHYDPDLCGSIPNFEDIIDKPDIMIISHKENNMFIRHYQVKSPLISHDAIKSVFRFSSGRTLTFHNIPYAHSSGSFITFDRETGVLFTSDLFGSYGSTWDLFLKLTPKCRTCIDTTICTSQKKYCPLPDFINYHRHIMTSDKALSHAAGVVSDLNANMLAPQHGSVIHDQEDIRFMINLLMNLKGVGIDGILNAEQSK